jgi:hypothetical protein
MLYRSPKDLGNLLKTHRESIFIATKLQFLAL